ncbi:MAG: hypothetical protein H6Q60_330 [Oscillospiraceae bacterium]|nr:hypothetical protein [Oscillospiraceae bacterium]
MIDFKTPEPSDRSWVNDCLERAKERGCEYNFINLVAWQQEYKQVCAQVDGFFVERLCGSLGGSYLFPVGGTDLEGVVGKLTEDANAQGQPLRLICVTPDHIKELEARFPGEFEYTTDRFGFDYLYEIDRLADLNGKKLHAKRNHINSFQQEYPDWTFELITPENLPECMEMDEQWYRLNRGYDGDETLGAEGIALRTAMQHYYELGLDGGLLRAGGRVVAFTVGSAMFGDTYDVHFEKAFSDVRGAYAMINREFVRWIREHYPQVRYINREDDMGVEGLRKAKESYYPDLMVEKHSAIRKSEGLK